VSHKSIINQEMTGEEPVSAINVTSLVDVMICLLIIFMVAAPMLTPEGELAVDLPAARGEQISEEEFLYTIISVDKTGRAFLGTLPLSAEPDKMKQEIATNVKIKEDGKVFLQGDKNVEHGKIVDILVALKDAEVSEVAFVTDPNPANIKAMEEQQ
jgi:biopolymer transport protein ExbD